MKLINIMFNIIGPLGPTARINLYPKEACVSYNHSTHNCMINFHSIKSTMIYI